MSEFKLEIITPNFQFFDGTVNSLTFLSSAGNLEVLAGHQAMIAVVCEGELAFTDAKTGERKTAFCAGGFAEVRPDETVIFTNYCDYETDIEEARLKMKQTLEAEREQHIKSISQQKRNRIAITRAIDNIKKKPKKTENI